MLGKTETEGVTLTDLVRQAAPGQHGALWRLRRRNRQLDANVIRFPGGGTVAGHVEPEVDVLVIVVAGSGRLTTADAVRELTPGAVAVLPRGTDRAIEAGATGLILLTAHRRRAGLRIGRRTPVPAGTPHCDLHLVCRECHRHAIETDARFCSGCGTALPARSRKSGGRSDRKPGGPPAA